MADDAIYRLAHRDASYNASFAARKTQKVNSVAAQAATPTRFLALNDDNAGALGMPHWVKAPFWLSADHFQFTPSAAI
jgi:hypothetical protein